MTIWGLWADKAPGLDGFPILFYHYFWDIIVTYGSLHGETLQLDWLNYAHAMLIQKKGEAREVGDFMLISMLNVSVKIISKVLTNKIRDALRNIIDDHQIGFLKGRNILNAVVTPQEVIEFTKRSKILEFMLELDFEKDYTTPENSNDIDFKLTSKQNDNRRLFQRRYKVGGKHVGLKPT